jgi:hypothetical protein
MNKLLIAVLLVFTFSINAYAVLTSSATIQLTMVIEKKVSVAFEQEAIELNKNGTPSAAKFNVLANTEYKVSTESTGSLTNANGDSVGFSTSINNNTLIITPERIAANQATGAYSTNLKLTVSAI